MTLVVDASVAVRWLLRSGADRAYDLFKGGERVIAPDLVLPEIANAVWKAVAFEGLSTVVATQAVAEAGTGFDELVASIKLKDQAFSIASDLLHPAYDCFYLALAEKRDCQLVTADGRLFQRCQGTPYAQLVRQL